jgi:hypothetical protein
MNRALIAVADVAEPYVRDAVVPSGQAAARSDRIRRGNEPSAH